MKIFGYSCLGFFNRFIFQHFFFRLARNSEKEIKSVDLKSANMVDGNSLSVGYRINEYGDTYQWYSLMLFVVPYTGWGIDYIFIFKKPVNLRITKKKVVEV